MSHNVRIGSIDPLVNQWGLCPDNDDHKEYDRGVYWVLIQKMM